MAGKCISAFIHKAKYAFCQNTYNGKSGFNSRRAHHFNIGEFQQVLDFHDTFMTQLEYMANVIKVRAGKSNISVSIYRVKTGDYNLFQVADYSTGKRKLISLASEKDARKLAKDIGKKLANLNGGVVTLKSSEGAAYRRALELLKPTGKALELVAAEYAEAHRRLGGRSLKEAIDFFLSKKPASMPDRSVADVVKKMVDAKTADGASAAYLKDLGVRLNRFADDFTVPIASITEVQLSEWLRALDCGPRGRNNYRMAIGTLYKFAEAENIVPDSHMNFKKVAKAKGEHGAIAIYTPKEIDALLQATRLTLKAGTNIRYATGQGLLPLIVLGAFCGLRTAEIERQLWSDINLERGFIRVTAAKGNTAQKRLVPLTDNAKQWLAMCRRDGETCCDYGRTSDAIKRLAERAGVKWKRNALRHSFISYRVAQTQNIPQVSLEAGNSVQMINRHYRELVTSDEATAWFGIMPTRSKKVVTLPTAAGQ